MDKEKLKQLMKREALFALALLLGIAALLYSGQLHADAARYQSWHHNEEKDVLNSMYYNKAHLYKTAGNILLLAYCLYCIIRLMRIGWFKWVFTRVALLVPIPMVWVASRSLSRDTLGRAVMFKNEFHYPPERIQQEFYDVSAFYIYAANFIIFAYCCFLFLKFQPSLLLFIRKQIDKIGKKVYKRKIEKVVDFLVGYTCLPLFIFVFVKSCNFKDFHYNFEYHWTWILENPAALLASFFKGITLKGAVVLVAGAAGIFYLWKRRDFVRIGVSALASSCGFLLILFLLFVQYGPAILEKIKGRGP